MTVAIIPMLIEMLPLVTGAVAGAAACAFFYLRHKQTSAQSTEQKNNDTSTPAALKQGTPKPVVSAVEAIADEVTPLIETAKPVEASDEVDAVPEDEEESILKRHYLHNTRVMLEATTFPRPTDSVLSRHYDDMIDAKAEDCLADESKMARLIAEYEASQRQEAAEEIFDEEPMLRRHHLHQIRIMLEAITFPRPEDSTLSRHYDEMIDAKAEDCLVDESKMERLLAEYEAYEQVQVVNESVAEAAGFKIKPCVCVPEDSTLRRHFLTQLQADIEKTKHHAQ